MWGVGTAAAQHPPAGRDGEVAGIRQQAPGTRGGAERRRASVCVGGGEAHLAAGRGWAGRTSGGSGSRGGAAPLVCWMQHNRGAGPQARPPRSAGGPRSAGPTRGDSDRRLGWALSPLTAHTHTHLEVDGPPCSGSAEPSAAMERAGERAPACAHRSACRRARRHAGCVHGRVHGRDGAGRGVLLEMCYYRYRHR